MIERPSGLKPYQVVVAPYTPAGGHVSCALVLVRDPEATGPDLRSTLGAMFGLTAAEADLAARLLDGLRPEKAAEARGVGLPTVRTQLQSILSKTGARGQAQLLATLARLPQAGRARPTARTSGT